jgi:hypothetical protein
LVVSVYFLFGILLREAGFSNQEVILAWVVVGLAQGALLFGMDALARKLPGNTHGTLVRGLAIASLILAAVMAYQGISLVWFSAMAILMLPMVRESVHAGIFYVRDKEGWALGTNIASFYANEMGKGFGALSIFFLGYFSSIGSQYVAAFIALCLAACIGKSFAEKITIDNDQYDPKIGIGAAGRSYVIISTAHNGAFFAMKSILTLILFDLLIAGETKSVIILLAAAISIFMLLGMVGLNLIKERIETAVSQFRRLSMMAV